MMKMSFFGYGYKLRRDGVLVVCRVLCAEWLLKMASIFIMTSNFWRIAHSYVLRGGHIFHLT